MRSAMPFVCPVCRFPVVGKADAYVCSRCSRTYPVLLGIADFRISPDRWLSIEEDRVKGLALETRTSGASFAQMVETYWEMTPDTPRPLAQRFIDHVMRAERRSEEWVTTMEFGEPAGLPVIDLGCGTGDLAAVLARTHPVVAVDIAFRWLVVARRRLQEARIDGVTLVCADAEALPLATGSAGRVMGLGLLEHVSDCDGVLTEAHRVLASRGRACFRTTNRYSLLAEPHVNVWGVGYLPRRTADAYVRWRGGQGYRHLRPLSARELSAALMRARFGAVAVRPAVALPSELQGRSWSVPLLARRYNRLARGRWTGQLLAWIAPVMEGTGLRA